jgi:hypothetical protein
VLQARVQYLFDAMQFDAPEVAHFVEALVYTVESRIHVTSQIRYAAVEIIEP